MTSRRINGSNTTPTYDGEDSCVFTVKLHISGNLVWKPKVEYRDDFVEYFDHFNCDEVGEIQKKKIELRKVSIDADILVLNLEVPTNKELDMYVEHLYDDQWDYEVEISRSLGDDALMTDEGDEGDEGTEQNSEREVDGPDNEFQEIDVEVNGPTSKHKVDEVEVDVDEVDCVHSEEIFRSLDDYDSDSDSERECNGSQIVFQERNLKKDGFKFVLGMIFKSASEFKWAVKYHEAMRRKDFKFVKNEGRRVRVTKHQAYRPKQKAKREMEGQDSDQFMLLNDYCEELRRSNHVTTVKMKLDGEFSVNGRPRFLRLYICFGACKEGFLRGCRPFFGLDGCHLKGCQKGGQLLSVVGVDGDNCMFPIAFATVEGELKDSRVWFLQQLDSDFNIANNPHAWTIISDKQKGLLPAVEQLFPGVEHRLCIRHMHANFLKDGFTGNVLKQKLWGVCKATTEAEFKRQMEELKLENEKVAEWLAARDPKHYCRAFFSTFPKSNMLLNNLCESWNSTILSSRDKPLMTMYDKIRLYLMGRMQKNRDKMKTYPHKICPKTSKCLEEAKDKSTRYNTYKSTDNLYQVDDHNFKAFKVDLAQRQCSCRGWDLTGIPCSHVVAAIRKHRESPEDYVDLPAPLPPKYKAQPGRPKKKRKIDPLQESKQQKRPVRTKKVGEVKRSRVCGMTRHNKTTCKGKNPQVEGQAEVEGQTDVEGHSDVEGQANVEGHSDVEGQADALGQFEDVPVETQVPTFVLDELGSQEVVGSHSSQTLHNQVAHESSFIALHTTSSSANAAEDMLRIGQRSITL
nr:uncharacterized protein LOC109185560 [Ipomoea batatas]